MSPGATFERVYRALKEQLGHARFAAGEHLEPAALSQDLNASITPVRDALHRLVGEGLVEAPRGDGFRTPLLTEVGLRHLYRWNAVMLGLAARTRHAFEPARSRKPAGTDLTEMTERLFLTIGGWTGNPEHVAALARLNDRLRPIRFTEAVLMTNLEEEIGTIGALVDQGASPTLRRALTAFHRRRERIADEIVAAMLTPR